MLSLVQLFVTPWTVAYQAPQSMEFSRQEYWSGLPFLSPRDLPNPGIEPGYPTLQADALPSEPPGKSKQSEVAQSCPTLCNPMDYGLPCSSVHGTFQARVLEWAAISFSRWSSRPGIEPGSPAEERLYRLSKAEALPSEPPGKSIKKVNAN